MRNICFIILLLESFSSAFCQIFQGTVYDRVTDSTLCGAVIYISGTSIGTTTDFHGNFKLDISKYREMPITISLLGYYSFTISEHTVNKMNLVYLSPKIIEINEVVIKAKTNWKYYLQIFKREFLGNSENSLSCEILNEKQLRLIYNPQSGSLIASSMEPILIHNKALAYTITYYLDTFNYCRSEEGRTINENFLMLGNYLFKDEISTLNESEKMKVLEKRKKTFLGSRMHFFRLLYQGNLIKTNEYKVLLTDKAILSPKFSIFSNTALKAESLVIKNDSISGYLKNKETLFVRHRLKASKLDLKLDSVYFQKNGYFDPLQISFSGDMSKQRIGDLLPYEYIFN